MRLRRKQFVPSDVAASAAIGSGVHLRAGSALSAARGVEDESAITRQVFPPWLYPLSQGNDYLINTFANGTAKTAVLAAVAGATVTSDAFVAPQENAAANQFVSIFVDAPNLTINVDWILRINQAPVAGWSLTTFPRVANNLSVDFSGIVRIPVGAVVDVLIVNRAATGPWTVGVQFGGWYWSRTAGKKLYGDIY